MSQLPSSNSLNNTPHSLADPSLLDWLSMSFFPGVGRATVHRLVEVFGTPDRIFSARPEELREVEGIGRQLAARISDQAQVQGARCKAEKIVGDTLDRNCSVVCPADDRYPSGLLHIPDAPLALYCQGDMSCLAQPLVAIVGSRAATTYGKRVSFELARELARHGVVVISGMAMGIDGEAHRGALAGGGKTIGVLGCGIDMIYPHQHAELFGDVAANGLLLSEYPPGISPDGFRFPERNRIISGISSGTLVVEASLKSGSLITARLALDQGRDVFAVPGRIDSPKSQGTHRLLQQGAKLVNSVDDILEELDLAGLAGATESSGSFSERNIELSEEEKLLLSCLDIYPVTIDELVRDSGYDTATVFQMLFRLEMEGIVRQLPGQQYELLHK